MAVKLQAAREAKGRGEEGESRSYAAQHAAQRRVVANPAAKGGKAKGGAVEEAGEGEGKK